MKTMDIGNKKVRLPFGHVKGAKYKVVQHYDVCKFEEALNTNLEELEDKGDEVLDVALYHTEKGGSLYHTADIWYLKK